ncbi:hypothetical protein NLN96_18840 [Citrobacter portucalensis]|uniref:hypothetical protein n=1 Tax=Citrobacter portucalensis TaxID=1639133 RepID=UPI00226B9B90|nr:hypothetical protein [Citrobacter portucalensis]MCX9019055.1 hypothetical protein [Citrobacter portucalensis]
MKLQLTAAGLVPGMEIRRNKVWKLISLVVWLQNNNTRITFTDGDVLTMPHTQKVNYRTPVIDRHNGAHYAPAVTSANASDAGHGVDIFRHK